MVPAAAASSSTPVRPADQLDHGAGPHRVRPAAPRRRADQVHRHPARRAAPPARRCGRSRGRSRRADSRRRSRPARSRCACPGRVAIGRAIADRAAARRPRGPGAPAPRGSPPAPSGWRGPGVGIDAVERDARPAELVVERRPEEDARRSWRGSPAPPAAGARQPLEARALRARSAGCPAPRRTARWLITRRRSSASSRSRGPGARSSASAKPSRHMPVSICSAAGRRSPAPSRRADIARRARPGG